MTDAPADRSADRGERRSTPAAVAAALAAVGVVWFVVDIWVTESRMGTFGAGADLDRIARLRDGFMIRMWGLLVLTLVAIGLSVVGMIRSPGRRRRIANAMGVCAVLGLVVAFVAWIARGYRVVGDEASTPIWLSLLAGILAAGAGGVVARRAGGQEQDPLTPSGRRNGRRVLIAGAVCGAVGFGAFVRWAAIMAPCHATHTSGQDAMFALALAGGAAAAVLGLVAVVMRRWALGLVVGLAGMLVVALTFAGLFMSCVS